jgi:cell division protein FtsL
VQTNSPPTLQQQVQQQARQIEQQNAQIVAMQAQIEELTRIMGTRMDRNRRTHLSLPKRSG